MKKETPHITKMNPNEKAIVELVRALAVALQDLNHAQTRAAEQSVATLGEEAAADPLQREVEASLAMCGNALNYVRDSLKELGIDPNVPNPLS